MTFNAIVPLSTTSPGVFPAQNNTNFTRLKTIISGDHIFNDTQADNDGTHKQVTITFRADPTSLPTGTNGIMFSKLDAAVSNAAQVYWYNGTTIQQMTGQTHYLTGKATLNAGDQLQIFANPGYTYVAQAWGAVQGDNTRFKLKLCMKQTSGSTSTIDESGSPGTNVNFAFDGSLNLFITNPSSSSLSLIWAVSVIRLIP